MRIDRNQNVIYTLQYNDVLIYATNIAQDYVIKKIIYAQKIENLTKQLKIKQIEKRNNNYFAQRIQELKNEFRIIKATAAKTRNSRAVIFIISVKIFKRIFIIDNFFKLTDDIDFNYEN